MVYPVKVASNRYTAIAAPLAFADALPPDEVARNIATIAANPNPAFRLAPHVYVEVSLDGRGGDFTVYLPARRWMARRVAPQSWRVSVGLFRPFALNYFGWTDLWLGVAAYERQTVRPQELSRFADELEQGNIANQNAALALKSFDALLAATQGERDFPTWEMGLAERFFALHEGRPWDESENNDRFYR